MDMSAEKEDELLPAVALGAAAIRVAQALNEKLGGLELYGITDMNEDADGFPELAFPASRPIRFLLYDCAEAGTGAVKAFAAKMKEGGKLFAFEIAAHGEKMKPSWRIGTDVLIRVEGEAQCLAAAGALLPMVAPQLPAVLDMDDVLALFDGTDIVRVGIGTAADVQMAVGDALAQLGWKPEFLRGILLSLSGGEDLGMREMDAATSSVMECVSEECTIVFSAEADPALEGRVRVTILATCGKRKGSHDASDWMMEILEEQFKDGENRQER